MQIIEEQNQPFIIDLDEIVEQWIWHTWKKTKLLSRYKREDLLITINWKNVTFTQNNIDFSDISSSYFPRILNRTNFDNKTTNEHLYNFEIKRSTYSTLKILFTHTLHKTQESNMIFHLPQQIKQFYNDLQTEQSIQFGQDTTKEYEIPWNLNSQIRVPSATRIIANLNIDEEEISTKFSLLIQFSGRIIATIATRQSPNICLKFIVGDIVQIICKAMKTNHRLNSFKIIENNPPSIGFLMRGICSFRYGIRQNIVLNQESLELSSSSTSSCSDFDIKPSAPSEYPHLISTDSSLIDSNLKNRERL
ncbi:unnamed protein product [Adineta steineri]|uniref:Uncharacterized protein n=1 Tax=Adineta steineri TaxID=433720 RepID=A0A814ZSK5_9BILA|nr:unnamed protein product [Adineta steineri]CAF1496647.1 unnamed protein product [Adineta steineri]